MDMIFHTNHYYGGKEAYNGQVDEIFNNSDNFATPELIITRTLFSWKFKTFLWELLPLTRVWKCNESSLVSVDTHL